jgi:hypothetical protein
MIDKKQMTFEQFFDSIDYYTIDTWIDETYWEGEGCSSAWMKRVYEWVLEDAAKAGVTMTDVSDDFDYESFLENVYECAEKGLS